MGVMRSCKRHHDMILSLVLCLLFFSAKRKRTEENVYVFQDDWRIANACTGTLGAKMNGSAADYQGYVERFQDASEGRWEREFCTLTEGQLQCFASPSAAVPLVELSLSARCTCEAIEWKPHALRVATPAGTAVCLAAPSAQAASSWLSRLRRAIAGSGAASAAPGASVPSARQQARQMHQFTVSGSVFDIDARYRPIKPIGSGAYGLVIAAHDSEVGDKVAIKKVHRAFDDPVGAKRVLRELKLLMHFDHDNVISIQDILPPPAPPQQPGLPPLSGRELRRRSLADFVDVYIVTDLMETDLHRVIYSEQALDDEHVQYFLYQILCALKYIHSAGVMHRDLKPSNVLLNSNCDLKICDFGLARGVLPSAPDPTVASSTATAESEAALGGAAASSQPSDLTEYVVTRWYRAPEIMLSCHTYHESIDMWSVGCMLAEMLGRKPLFPGTDYINQLKIIVEKLGSPTEGDLSGITNDKARRFMLQQHGHEPQPMASLFPSANPQAIDLLECMLHFDPEKRISVEAALQHPYMASLHAEEDEPVAEAPFRFDSENVELDKETMQELVLDEVAQFHPEWAPEEVDEQDEQRCTDGTATAMSAVGGAWSGHEHKHEQEHK